MIQKIKQTSKIAETSNASKNIQLHCLETYLCKKCLL